MAIRLDHIAIAVKNIEEATKDFEKTLGVPCESSEHVPTESSTVAFFNVGDTHIELVCPDNPDSPMGRSLDKRGEGLHHICLEVDDIESTVRALVASGVRMVDAEPKPGAKGTKIAFIHPKSVHGVLVELVEKP